MLARAIDHAGLHVMPIVHGQMLERIAARVVESDNAVLAGRLPE
jgi:hypothetical protein